MNAYIFSSTKNRKKRARFRYAADIDHFYAARAISHDQLTYQTLDIIQLLKAFCPPK